MRPKSAAVYRQHVKEHACHPSGQSLVLKPFAAYFALVEDGSTIYFNTSHMPGSSPTHFLSTKEKTSSHLFAGRGSKSLAASAFLRTIDQMKADGQDYGPKVQAAMDRVIARVSQQSAITRDLNDVEFLEDIHTLANAEPIVCHEAPSDAAAPETPDPFIVGAKAPEPIEKIGPFVTYLVHLVPGIHRETPLADLISKIQSCDPVSQENIADMLLFHINVATNREDDATRDLTTRLYKAIRPSA